MPGKDESPFLSIDVSAVNVGSVPVTLRAAGARILGGPRFAVSGWLHQEPKALGSRAVLNRGEAWVGLLDFNDFVKKLEQAADTPPPWRVVFWMIDANENRYEEDEADPFEFAVDDYEQWQREH